MQDEKAILLHYIPSSKLGLVCFKLCHIQKICKMKRQFSGIIFQVPDWVWYDSNCVIFTRFTRWKGNFLALYSKFQTGFGMFQIVPYLKDLQDEKAIFWHYIPSSKLGLITLQKVVIGRLTDPLRYSSLPWMMKG